METALFFLHYALLFLFGLLLSYRFAGIPFSKKNIAVLAILFVVLGLAQLGLYLSLSELQVWELYPIIVHVPIILSLCLYYRKQAVTAIAAMATAYLCCQPAKCFGLLLEALHCSHTLVLFIEILTLLIVCAVVLLYLTEPIASIYTKEPHSIMMFAIVPIVYYIFDYSLGIYTNLWVEHSRSAAEFLAFFLCFVHLIFCAIYHKIYEQKADAERKEQILRITVEQQAKEFDAVRRSEHEIKLLRHDMRLFLSGLSLCIDEGDQETAKKMISSYISTVDNTKVVRYCQHDILNYVLSHFSKRCEELGVEFIPSIQLSVQIPDEVLFSSILSNALDNALNAQKDLPGEKRKIKIMLKTQNDRTLLSVKNPFSTPPLFVDGMPVSKRKGHGYGTQSICYMTEKLGGDCQFSIENNHFLLRIII